MQATVACDWQASRACTGIKSKADIEVAVSERMIYRAGDILANDYGRFRYTGTPCSLNDQNI